MKGSLADLRATDSLPAGAGQTAAACSPTARQASNGAAGGRDGEGAVRAFEKPQAATSPRAPATKKGARGGGGEERRSWSLLGGVSAGTSARAGSSPQKEKRPLRGVGPGMLSPAGCMWKSSRTPAECQDQDPWAWRRA